ncbi:NADP-dependent oxidoreductase [Actinoplanes sp. TBRC 11911]|uniref:NADP-dependent oxidoreductase n=1 Tax=Actinoplanes sp. TBRC 11911 TaxID=2729386 RepID=UPI00145E0F02|nr:NADP-dependent oxidoreductase [Actinoplanes sp. TBRC 11911]NMO51730.1 NADP-dependent oxidoreductase [Actinoplanes sp. TBRC 11911]
MRALHVPAAGQAPQLAELPIPEVTDGQVLIRVKAAGLNPLDNGVAAGALTGMLPHEYPLILGRDAAGVVEAVGAGVEHVQPGDEVIGHVLLAPPIRQGTLAEFALLPAEAVALKPAGLSFAAAAALPLAGAAAVATIDAVDAQPGQVVLVNGATGGVGSFAVQLLAARGVTVVATGTATDAERLSQLGATTVVDHTGEPVAEQVRAVYPDGVDALIDLASTDAATAPLGAVRKGGRVAALSSVAGLEDALAEAGLTGGGLLARAAREVTGPLAEQAADGSLAVDVTTVLPFDRATEGLAALAAGHARGKTVITIQD